ncbi:mitochondrial carrier homolog 2-like [Tigriopus californicus]|nr:mitochondrial carrier homolog 2-like [Tigriopus californicus]
MSVAAEESDWPASFHDPYVHAALKAGVVALLHPMDYAKTLIQLGHEPLKPVNTTTFLGHPKLMYPSIFAYIGHIRRRDGLVGLYAGLGPRVVSMGLSAFTGEYFAQRWPALPTVDEEEKKKGRPLSEQELQDRLVQTIWRDATLKVTCSLVTHPLQVMAVRTMAQFVGHESKYKGLMNAFYEVISENGFIGFWAGWVPRAIGEVCMVAISYSMTYAINKYILSDKEMQKLTGHVSEFLTSSLVYPFTVVSNVMIVSKSGLAAGYPPFMPLYSDWLDCFRHLNSQKQLKRGSKMIFRYYTGPQQIVGNKVFPVDANMFMSKNQ